MITVMSWNMNRNVDAWGHFATLAASEDVEVGLVQEAKHPSDLLPGWTTVPPAGIEPGDEQWRISVPRYYRGDDGEAKETRRWFGSAIAARNADKLRPRPAVPLHDAVEGDLACSHPGQFAVADVETPGGQTLTVISLYGIWDRMSDSGDLYSEATLHRAISDLTSVFQERAAEFVLIAGDLNVYSYSDGSVWGDRWLSVFQRLSAYGIELCGPFRPDDEPRLERCPCPDSDCRHVNTFLFRRNPENKPYQVDFFLASEPLRQRLVRCWADSDPRWYDHSDHRAIFATFDL